MWENTYRILVVGPHEFFSDIFDHLEANESYDLRYASDFEAARAFLKRDTPSAILLALSCDGRKAQEALTWVDTVKHLAPVLVLSPIEDMDLYLAVMERGASDFFTPFTTLEEIDRELNDAVTRHSYQAA